MNPSVYLSHRKAERFRRVNKGSDVMKAVSEFILIIVSVLIALTGTWVVLGPIANSFGPVVAAFSWVVVAYTSIVVFNAEIK